MNAFLTLEDAVIAAELRFHHDIADRLAEWSTARKEDRPPFISVNGPGGSGKDQTASYIAQGIGWGPSALGQFAVSNAVKEMVGWCLNVEPDWAYMCRRDHRAYWFEWCNIFRRNDPTILAKLAMRGSGLVSGVRAKVEFDACRQQQVFDLAVWVDRPGLEEIDTLEVGRDDCDYVIPNLKGRKELKEEVHKFLDKFGILMEGRN